MAGLNRRLGLAATVLPLLVLAMAGWAHAATLFVTSTTDSGAGTLRAQITAASAGDTIEFSVTGTISLLSTLSVSKNLTITGPTPSPGITISGNNAVQVMIVISGAALNISNLTIANGLSTVPGDGGGIFNFDGTLTVTNCTFSGNNAGDGGGIANGGGGTAAVTNSIFSGNSADFDGGGIVNGGTLTVANSTFSGNTSPSGSGGIANDGTLTVTNSTFSGNSAAGGGGIANDGTLTVTNSTFSGNSGGLGGGIENLGGGALTVTNSTFSDNSATGGGGAIFNDSSTAAVTNSTLSGNSAGPGLGGGVLNFGFGASLTLKGTILAAESTGGNCAGTITDDGFNIADDGSCGFTVPPIGTSINNSTALNLDPLGLQNNGGPTRTIALEPNSQAVDFIPVASCTVTTDQRGFPRPDGGNLSFCDAGAFELQTERIVLVPGSEKTQIARSTSSSDSDQVNLAFTFDDIGNPTSPACNAGTDALNGVDVDLFEGTCADLATATGGLLLDLSPFVVHTVGTETYGTLFQKSPTVPSPETVSVRIVQLAGPGGDICGKWTVNIEVAGLDTAAIGLGGGNPFALVVEDSDKNEGCFDIDDAIVGNQITPPHGVRRGSRRGRK